MNASSDQQVADYIEISDQIAAEYGSLADEFNPLMSDPFDESDTPRRVIRPDRDGSG